MWKKLKHILWILFDEYLHYISTILFIFGLFIEYIYMCIDLCQLIFLGSISVLCFGICYIQGIKKGEDGVNVVKMMEFHADYIKNLIEKIPAIKDTTTEIH